MKITKNPWLWLLTIVIVLLLFITFAVPQIGVLYAKRWLMEQGADQVDIARVRFNPFIGRIAVKGIDVAFPEQPPISIELFETELQWRSLWSKRFHIKTINLSNVSTPITVNQDSVYLSKLAVWKKADAPSEVTVEPLNDEPWQFQIDDVSFNRLNFPLEVFETPVDLYIESLNLSRLDSSQVDQAAHVSFSGKLNDEPLQWNAEITPFAKAPEVSGQWKIDQVDLARLAPFFGEGMAALKGKLDGDANLSVAFKESSIELSQQGQISLGGFVLPEIFSADKLQWDGDLALVLTLDDSVGQLSLSGQLDSQEIKSFVKDLEVRAEGLSWQGKFAMTALTDVHTMTMNADALLSSVAASNKVAKQTISQLRIQLLGIQPNLKVSVGEVKVDKLAANNLQHGDAKFTLASTRVAGIQFSDEQGLSLESIESSDAFVSIIRNEQGEMLLPFASEVDGKEANAETEAVNDGSVLAVALGEFKLAGKNQLVFDDQMMQPASRNEFIIDQLQISDVSTSDDEVWSPFNIQLRQGEYGQLLFKGKLRQPGEQMDLSLEGDVSQLELIPWSSYLATATGYQVKHGVLDSTLKMKVDKGILDAETELYLHNLKVERADDELAQQMETSMSMPLDSALSMLRDNDNNIKLTIPVTGDIQSPDFDVSDAMNQAIAKALSKGTMSYLKYALQPYGALIMVGEIVGEQAGKVSFAPIKYELKQTEVGPEHLEYLSKMAAVMKDRPNIRLTLCGVAVIEDIVKIKKEKEVELDEKQVTTLRELAALRAVKVKKIMVDQHGVDSDRLFTCNPIIDREAEAHPRVDVSL